MKRLIFCFDGTWNKLGAEYPTNVVLTAESVVPTGADGIAQMIFYDDGVGTTKHEYFKGGIFGYGLLRNIADGYRFLIFNYEPGDEIYVFGFSRGAYTARSFVGMLQVGGVLLRRYASKVEDTIALYRRRKDTDEYRQEAAAFRRRYSPPSYINIAEVENLKADGWTPQPLSVTYLGVWDTVGSLGIPSRFTLGRLLNKRFEFHDTKLTPFVKSARHAVAIDERRKDFVPTLWDNILELNMAAGKQPDDVSAPYQQMWFPGVHSSVGGGGERRGLSDSALDWILQGARVSGLAVDINTQSTLLYELKPNYREFLDNSATDSLYYKLANRWAAADRMPGPAALHEVNRSAQRRWLEKAANLSDRIQYRPNTLKRVSKLLNALDPSKFGLGMRQDTGEQFIRYQVKPGDQLRRLAQHFYGSPEEYIRIYEANLDQLDDPNLIYAGMILRIPQPH